MAGGAGGVAGSVGGAETGGAGGEQPILDCAGIAPPANADGIVDVNDISYVLFRLGNPCP